MTTSVVKVAKAKAVIAQAEAAHVKEERARLTAQLKQVRASLRVKRPALERLQRQVFSGQADLDNLRRAQNVTIEALARLEAARPECADYLPDNAEVTSWSTDVATLKARVERLKLERMALPNIELLRRQGVELAQEVQSLLYAESSLLSVLGGYTARGRVGGSFGVL